MQQRAVRCTRHAPACSASALPFACRACLASRCLHTYPAPPRTQWESGSRYTGNWVANKREGKGSYVYAEGAPPRAPLLPAKSPAGPPGRAPRAVSLPPLLTPGHKYIGEFKDNKRHGHGKLKLENGDLYEGGFAEGAFHGHGVYDWASGISYEGEWVHGQPQGPGAMTWADGQRWDGYWKDGHPLYPEDAAAAARQAPSKSKASSVAASRPESGLQPAGDAAQ